MFDDHCTGESVFWNGHPDRAVVVGVVSSIVANIYVCSLSRPLDDECMGCSATDN